MMRLTCQSKFLIFLNGLIDKILSVKNEITMSDFNRLNSNQNLTYRKKFLSFNYLKINI